MGWVLVTVACLNWNAHWVCVRELHRERPMASYAACKAHFITTVDRGFDQDCMRRINPRELAEIVYPTR